METPTKKKIDLQLNFNCGCGFRSTDVTESESHTMSTGHQITVSGTIKKLEVPK